MRITEWRRSCRGYVSLGIVGVALTIPNSTRAEEPRYRVELHAPKYLPNCNDLEDFLVELDLVLNHSLLGSPATRVLDVRIEHPSGGSYAVDIVIKHVDGQVLSKQSQTYSGATECFKVLHKVAFIAAMEMEKDIPDEPQKHPESCPSQPAPKPACPPCPATPPRCPDVVASKRTEPQLAHRKRGFVGLGVGAYWNVAPEAFFAPHVRVGWYARQRVALELDFTGQAWTTTRPQEGPTIVDVKTALATIAGCYVVGSFMACGLVATEVRHASSSARADSIAVTRVFPLLGARASFDHQLVRSLSLRTNIDALSYPSERKLDGQLDALWQPLPFALGITTLLAWTF